MLRILLEKSGNFFLSAYFHRCKLRAAKCSCSEKILNYAVMLFSVIMYFVRYPGSMKAAQFRSCFQL